jgi:NAD(P)-dependent dehydrogenase (short-subunit alcohol dehydrogenase family)
MSLEGRTAVVTGAGGGIGRAIAVEFAQAGAKLVLVGRTEATLAETAEAVGGAESRVVAADVSRSDDVRRVVDETTAAFGTIDVLVNNHGVEGPVAKLTEYP